MIICKNTNVGIYRKRKTGRRSSSTDQLFNYLIFCSKWLIMFKKKSFRCQYTHFYSNSIFTYIVWKILNIFLICAFDVCPDFTFVVFETLKASVTCLWAILFLRSSFNAPFMFSSDHFSLFCFGLSDIFLWEKVEERLNEHLLI